MPMSLYNLTFHGSEDTKHVWLEGPELTIPIQKLCEAIMEPAALRCVEKFNTHKIEIFPEDIFDETIDMLTERGFKLVDRDVAVFSGIKVGAGDFADALGDCLESVLKHNKQCQNIFLRDVYEQVERDLGEKRKELCTT